MASGTINNPLYDIGLTRFAYKSAVSMNTLTASGLYMCDSCTNGPTGTAWSSFVIEVIGMGSNIKQIARPTASDGYCFERHCIGETWGSWVEIGRNIPVVGNTASTIYTRKPGDPTYGSFMITGTAAGLGGVLIGVTVNNGAVTTIRNLMTGVTWSDTNLTITYGLDGGVGYIGIKTTSSVGSNLCIIGG